MMRKIDGFKHLYKELFKEFERLRKERDQQLEDNDEYRRKTWLESMDLINQNLSNPPTVERQTPEMRFPKFEPSMASFDVDPPNIIPKKAYKIRKGN